MQVDGHRFNFELKRLFFLFSSRKFQDLRPNNKYIIDIH